MSDAVQVALIMAGGGFLTAILKVVTDMRKKVDGRLDRMLATQQALKDELARLAAGGTPTPITRSDAAGPPVTQRDGVVTVERDSSP
jgi:hypothetical protein